MRGHGGLLTVDSRPGEGTTFTVLLPECRRAAIWTAGVRGAAFERGTARYWSWMTRTWFAPLREWRSKRAGYRVLIALADGEEAGRIFASQPGEIDLVILDMTMPVMGGEEAMRRMAELRPDVVVLASSGYDESEAQQRFGSRIAGFLQKPYTAAQLTGTVGRLLIATKKSH